MHTFLNTQRREDNVSDLENMGEEWENEEREYNIMSIGFRREVSMGEYFHLNMNRRSKEHYIGMTELGRKVGKMEPPTFDGLDHLPFMTWVQKMDVYLQLNPME
jgi:hypothetical protein